MTLCQMVKFLTFRKRHNPSMRRICQSTRCYHTRRMKSKQPNKQSNPVPSQPTQKPINRLSNQPRNSTNVTTKRINERTNKQNSVNQRNFLGQRDASGCEGFPPFREVTPSPSSGCAGGMVAPKPSHHFWCYQITSTPVAPETSENLHIFTRLPAREHFIEFCHRESSKTDNAVTNRTSSPQPNKRSKNLSKICHRGTTTNSSEKFISCSTSVASVQYAAL